MPEPLLEIHPRTAGELGIKNGDMVEVESDRGKIKLKASLSEDVHPMIVAMQQGWNEANANYLTDDMTRDPISGYPALLPVLCGAGLQKASTGDSGRRRRKFSHYSKFTGHAHPPVSLCASLNRVSLSLPREGTLTSLCPEDELLTPLLSNLYKTRQLPSIHTGTPFL